MFNQKTNLRSELLGWRGEGGEAQGLHYGVVEGGADLLDLRVFARGVDTIGEEDYEELAVGIDPDAGAGEAGVTEAVCGKIMAAAAAFGGDGPAQGTRAAGKFLRLGELGYRGALEDAMVGVGAAVEEHLGEGGQVGRGAEEASVAGNAAEDVGVFVVHFTLN